ncbi:cell division protein FtsL [Desulfocicer vacuolatum DSM 3385]|uniref:Cell division protein FtsL n=1 Tax=Desulfocicer vacuolatum DSM 3385 TaxID=1121400 RepID=A0A1W1YH15_9BACT|nr:cell division protein FtsL [Desulfocicer vacuolatum]SMC35520.1 cell division protein FtsL [Desulfocicer vacuolatum DSM 3385]
MNTANRKKAVNSQGNTFQGKWIVFIVFFILELLLYTWIRVEQTHTDKRILLATQEQKTALKYRSELLVEQERLSSPERIMTIARDHLNLHTPDPDQIIKMDNTP